MVNSPSLATRVVGIGASAGGLAALEQFLGNVAPSSGLAFVIVQHLDPTHKALLAELLQRVTEMPVREASKNLRVEPNCVYVIPPDTEMSLVGGQLNLKRPREPRGLRLPINVLFSSLASDLGERAIAVVLSGMGSDGTMGLQAIKAAGGLTAVQQPDTAQFDMMPKSAIAAGCGDIVAPPAELPLRILAYVEKVPDSAAASDERAEKMLAPTYLNSIFRLLQARTRHDFSLYKPSTLHRRIERRMAIHSIATLAEYTDFLGNNPQEIDLLFKELLIGVTSFFRDPQVWEHLLEVALPQLLARRGSDSKLRAWSVGCSTGEEAYSLAMVFTEAIQRLPRPNNFSLQIFASDLSPDAIATARRGRYPASIAADVSAERLARFFTAHEQHYQINQSIRDMVLFAQHDVVLDPPFTKLDLLVCRNLLIYFDSTLQRKLLPLFRYSLLPSGLLLLGTSETVGKFNAMFSPIGERKLRVYLREDSGPTGAPDFLIKSLPRMSRTTPEYSLPPPNIPTHSIDNLQLAADQMLLQLYAPAAVVLNSSGDIVYISGRTGKYLEPAAGKANWNFHAMVREGLRAPLADALKKAATQREPLHLNNLQVQTPGGSQLVDVQVQVMQDPQALRGMTMIVFRDIAPVPASRRGRKPPTSLEAAHAFELQRLGDEIQALREESRASKEELQSANEELQSTNEELQSTNEELTTSKEEMQSMNEELQTINSELQTKLDDLALAQSDMQNLLNSTEIAILFLDQHLNVRRYTERAAKIVNVRESDVGRPLSDLTTSLQYPALHDDALETLRTMAFSEKQIPTNDDRWFSVRILPYRRLDNVIDGVVITFVDITATKQVEKALRRNS
ncbi:MAG TPA: chemotaxis protein CheB [Steroidobacteraceae bacterium]|nr:chemotaxis protein CheB [Steroidobacteraceae bacterium]